MESNYIDVRSTIQVLGCFYSQPSLLEDTHYSFTDKDFPNDFHRVIFGAMSNLYITFGETSFSTKTIENYLLNKPESLAIYKAQNGREWLDNAYKNADLKSYLYYAGRVKKMSLLRSYEEAGMDVSFILDVNNITDTKKKEEQETKFDEMSVSNIVDIVENKITRVKDIVADIDNTETYHAGENGEKYLDEILNGTQLGYPTYDQIFSNVIGGYRPGRFYIRSSNSGGGKSRSSMADACYLACGKIFENGRWQDVGEKIPTLFVSVELTIEELEILAWSFIANVPSDHIERNTFDIGEIERVKDAIKIEKESNLIFKFLPDYSVKDIENTIKREIREHNVGVVFFDYLASSATIMNEVSKSTGGVRGLQEYQILYMISDKLKNLCEQYGIAIITSTQTNASAKFDKVPDQNVLASSKSVINRADVGCVLLDCQPSDYEDIEQFSDLMPVQPNQKLSIFKVRAGKWNRIILWLLSDKGTCRFRTIAATDYNFNWISLDEIVPELRESMF